MLKVETKSIRTYECRGVTAMLAGSATGEYWNIMGGTEILFVLDPIRSVLTKCAVHNVGGSAFASVLAVAAQIMEDRNG